MVIKYAKLLTQDDVLLLSSAPIREAILQIRFEAEEEIDLEALSKIEKDLPPYFDEFSRARSSRINFKIATDEEKAESEAIHMLDGFKARSDDARLTAIFRDEEFTFSMMQPYSSWNDFRNVAKEVWDVFKYQLPSLEFSRVALRYINELSIPLDENEFVFDKYLKAPPRIPDELGENIEAYFSRIVIPFPDHKAKVVAINSFDSVVDNCVRIILDNDAFRTEVGDFSESDVWEYFETLRLIKDTVFFSSISDESIRLFK